jgi:acetyl esterase/lipase
MLLLIKKEWPQEKTFPLILMIPGSAWHKQELYNDIPKFAKLAERGFAIAVLEYRESEIAKFPAQVEDVSHALDFLATKAEQFHLNWNRIFLMGNSSGEHIAMMSVLYHAHGLCKPLPKIRGVISESGSKDILTCAKAPLPPWMKSRPSAALLWGRPN